MLSYELNFKMIKQNILFLIYRSSIKTNKMRNKGDKLEYFHWSGFAFEIGIGLRPTKKKKNKYGCFFTNELLLLYYILNFRLGFNPKKEKKKPYAGWKKSAKCQYFFLEVIFFFFFWSFWDKLVDNERPKKKLKTTTKARTFFLDQSIIKLINFVNCKLRAINRSPFLYSIFSKFAEQPLDNFPKVKPPVFFLFLSPFDQRIFSCSQRIYQFLLKVVWAGPIY